MQNGNFDYHKVTKSTLIVTDIFVCSLTYSTDKSLEPHVLDSLEEEQCQVCTTEGSSEGSLCRLQEGRSLTEVKGKDKLCFYLSRSS